MAKLVNSTQRNIQFFFCSDPVMIDKRSSWGDNADNLQKAPDGAFLKTDGVTITHLVQPNADKTAPIGWIPGDEPGLFHKSPIWIADEKVHQKGDLVKMATLDGNIEYEVTEPCIVCYNDDNGKPNMEDGWVQKVSVLEKNYVMPKVSWISKLFA